MSSQHIIRSLRDHPEQMEAVIAYFQQQWASEESMMVYDDALRRTPGAKNPLPQWYWLQDGERIIGCAGLITNDFISRGELYPWLCALYIDPEYRQQGLARRLIDHIARHTRELGFDQLHLCTDIEGFYEKAGFVFNGLGYHPWGESSRVYTRELSA